MKTIPILGLVALILTVWRAKTEEEVATLLQRAHCYAQPSIVTESGKMEGIPVALMEAMAVGLPVVATELSGVPELVRQGDTGILVPPADSVALADAIEHVRANPVEASERAAAARRLVVQDFELSRNVRALTQVFDRRLENHS